jgi:hypothetical protein
VDDINRFPESIEDNNSLLVPVLVYLTGYTINSGGPAVGSFVADANYAGSANTFSVTNTILTSGVSLAAPMAVYQTARWGEFAYLLNNLAPGSNYTVHLHFAEIFPSVNNAGERRFNVSVNGAQALTDFDVLAAAGTKFKALTKDIKMRADSSGTLLIEFSPGSAGDPICSGIQIFNSPAPSFPAITGLVVTNSTATLTSQSSPSAIYRIEYKDDLAQTNWTAAGGLLLAPGAVLTTTLPANAGQRFFRIVLVN